MDLCIVVVYECCRPQWGLQVLQISERCIVHGATNGRMYEKGCDVGNLRKRVVRLIFLVKGLSGWNEFSTLIRTTVRELGQIKQQAPTDNAPVRVQRKYVHVYVCVRTTTETLSGRRTVLPAFMRNAEVDGS